MSQSGSPLYVYDPRRKSLIAFVVLSPLTVFFVYLGLAYPPAPGDVGNAIYVIVLPLILAVAGGWRYAKAARMEFYETWVKEGPG